MTRLHPSSALAGMDDLRFMAAAIRLSARHEGRTATNPSVGTLIVRDDGAGPLIVGRGVTALGGRPHAETVALEEAGGLARGATAYVTLEPCAHHGRTPPCAQALVHAGVARVVGAASDPDPRVSGKGYALLRAAGIAVSENVLADEAERQMAGYLTRSMKKRPEVVLKLAVSRDGMLGRQGEGQIAITGAVARRQVHLLRARVGAVLIGIGTALADDPLLTVRLPGLEARSPARIVLDREARLPVTSELVLSARQVPLYVAAGPQADPARKAALAGHGASLLAAELADGRIALPELLEDIAALGISSLLVEGGAATARAFVAEDLVDRFMLFSGPDAIGAGGVVSPVRPGAPPAGFALVREAVYGADRFAEWEREA